MSILLYYSSSFDMRNKFNTLVNQDIVKGSALVFVGTIATNILNYLFHLVTGRMLGPDQYAVIASLISLSYVIGFIAQLINTITTQKVAALMAKNDVRAIKGFIIAMSKNVAVISVLVTGVFFVFQRYIADFLNIHDSGLVVLMGVGFAISLFMIIALALFQGQLRFFAHSVVSALSSALRVATAFFAIILNLGVSGIMWGMVLTSIATVGLCGIIMKPILKVKAKKVSFHTSSYSSKIWIALALFGKGMLINVDVMLVKHFFVDYDAGLYAALATLGKVVLFFASSISIALLPIASKKHAQGKSTRRELLLAQGLIILLSLGILVVYAIMPEFIIGLLYGNEYKAIAKYLWLIGMYFMFYNISYTFVNFFVARKETWILIAPLGAAVIQVSGIFVMHNSIFQILTVMIVSSILLVAVFAGYFFFYGRKK